MASFRLNGAALACAGPVGTKCDLRDVAGGRPFGGDEFGALRRAAVDERHVGMSRVRLVEAVPDQAMVVVVGTAGDDDLRARRNEGLAFGAFAGGDEVAAVDHRGGQMLVADLRAGAGSPGRAGVALVVGGGFVAQELEGVPSLDQRVALGRQSLQFDGADLRAVLGLLASALRLLVVVEFAFDAIDRAVEEVDRRPEERVEIGFEPACRRKSRRGRRRYRRWRSSRCAARAWGVDRGLLRKVDVRKAEVRRADARSERRRGRARLGRRRLRSWSWSSAEGPRPSRPSQRRHAARGAGPHPSEAEGRSGGGGRRRAGDFASRWKAPLKGAPENRRPAAVADPRCSPHTSPLKGRLMGARSPRGQRQSHASAAGGRVLSPPAVKERWSMRRESARRRRKQADRRSMLAIPERREPANRH